MAMNRSCAAGIALAISVALVACGGSSKLAGRYVDAKEPEAYLELKSDGTLYLQTGLGSLGLTGKYSVNGTEITLAFSNGAALRGAVAGDTLRFPESNMVRTRAIGVSAPSASVRAEPTVAQASHPPAPAPSAGAASSCADTAGRVLTLTQDAYVGSAYHKQGVAGDADLSFGGWGDYYYPYLSFEVPQGTSTAVMLCLYATAVPANDPELEIGLVTDRWEPSTLSIGARPAHRIVKRFGSIVAGWNAADITDIVRDWASGTVTNFGIVLIPGGNNQTNGAFAGSGAPNVEQRPKLVVLR